MNRRAYIILFSLALVIIGLAGIGLVYNLKQPPPSPTPAPSPTPDPNSRVVKVQAKVKWEDTRLYIRSGDKIRIEYISGKWSNGGTEPVFCDAEGFPAAKADAETIKPKLLIPGARLGCLIGKINTRGKPFPIGRSLEGRFGDGALFLSMNDDSDEFDDNVGEILVRVTILD